MKMDNSTVLDPIFGQFRIPDDESSVTLFQENLNRGQRVFSFKPHLRKFGIYPIEYAPKMTGTESAHTHEFIELIITVVGSAMHTFVSDSIPITRGDIVFTNNRIAHHFSACTDDFRIVNICFLPSALGYSNALLDDARVANHFALLFPFAAYEDNDRFSMIHPDERTFIRVLWYAFHMIEAFHYGADREIVLNAFKNILLMVISKVRTPEDAQGVRFHEILAFIREHAGDDISSASVAKHFGFSAAYFSTMFNRVSGDTLHGYLNRLRIRRAKELIERTSMPINRIAHEVGYHNISHFNVAFKRVMHCPPGSFRRHREPKSAK